METTLTYTAAEKRYDNMPYRHCGKSGLRLPPISLGLWHNFGPDADYDNCRAMLRCAFDLGITHFDLANNYGAGCAESIFGKIMQDDLRPYRDELIISSKAGYEMWPGPYGGNNGTRKYLIASLDQSLHRMGLDYVDIFYHHCPDPQTPLEETMHALEQIVRGGKALYVALSNYYCPTLLLQATRLLQDLGVPCLLHQASYSLLNRRVETEGTLVAAESTGTGTICFSSLAQGLLSEKYLNGIPEGSRAARPSSLHKEHITPALLEKIRKLNMIAGQRGQRLPQMALAWVLRQPGVTSAIIGASRVTQIEENLGALEKMDFTEEELRQIESALA